MTKRQLVETVAPLNDDAEILTTDTRTGALVPIDGVELTTVHVFPLKPWFERCYCTGDRHTLDVPSAPAIVVVGRT